MGDARSQGQEGACAVRRARHYSEGSGEPVTSFKQGRVLATCVFRKTTGRMHWDVAGVPPSGDVLACDENRGGGGRVEVRGKEHLGHRSDLQWEKSVGGQGCALGSAGSTESAGWVCLRQSSLRGKCGQSGSSIEEGARNGHLPQSRADAGTEMFLCSSQSVPCLLPKGPGEQ